MKTLTGVELIQEISFDAIKNLYACGRRKKKYRIICGKLVNRDNCRYRLWKHRLLRCVHCEKMADKVFLVKNKQNHHYSIHVGFIDKNYFVDLNVDHIQAISNGGSQRDMKNQQILCNRCNQKKSNKENIKYAK